MRLVRGMVLAAILLGVVGCARSEPVGLKPEANRDEFCALAKRFELRAEKVPDHEAMTLMQRMAEMGSPRLRDDIGVLLQQYQAKAASSADLKKRIKKANERSGQFIENECGINLPGVRI